jgi:hypothetical protein
MKRITVVTVLGDRLEFDNPTERDRDEVMDAWGTSRVIWFGRVGAKRELLGTTIRRVEVDE